MQTGVRLSRGPDTKAPWHRYLCRNIRIQSENGVWRRAGGKQEIALFEFIGKQIYRLFNIQYRVRMKSKILLLACFLACVMRYIAIMILATAIMTI